MKYLLILFVFLFISCNNSFDYNNPYHVKKDFVNENPDKCHKDSDCKKENHFCIFDDNSSQTGHCINPCDSHDCSQEGENSGCVLNDKHEPYCVCKEDFLEENNQCIKIEWQKVSVGDKYTCGIMNKNLYCWGRYNASDYKGVLGLGKNAESGNRTEPVKVGNDNWIDVSCGGDYACGIKEDNTLWCWGVNFAKITKKEDNYLYSPQQLGNQNNWAKVFANKEFDINRFTCALNTDEELYCFGYSDSQEFTKVENRKFKEVFVAINSFLAVDDTDILREYYIKNEDSELTYCDSCFQSNDSYRSVASFGPEYVNDGTNDMLSNIFALKKDGKLFRKRINEAVYSLYGICGSSLSGKITDNGDTQCNLLEAEYIAGGKLYGCIISRGSIYCINLNLLSEENDYGLKTIIKNKDKFYKLDKPDESIKWISVSVGYDHICAIDKSKSLYCIGNGNDGQLGVGGMNKGSENFTALVDCYNEDGSHAYCKKFNKVKSGVNEVQK